MVGPVVIVDRRRIDREPDVMRGIAAAWHLRRSLELELRRRELVAAGRGPTAVVWLERARDEHSRIARGFLGAIGFERDSLWRRMGGTFRGRELGE